MVKLQGHETKAVLLSWSVKFLIAHPEKQEKLRRALMDAFPNRSSGEQPPLDAITSTSIPYLQAYMEESMRVANTSPRLVRTTTANTQVLGCSIPKGTSVILNPYIGTEPLNIPHDLRSETSKKATDNVQQYWDPSGMDDFLPERWLTEDGIFNPRKFPRLAFSAGPRMCYGMSCFMLHFCFACLYCQICFANTSPCLLGRNLALLEFRVNLVLLVLNFKFEPLPLGMDSMESQQRLFRMPRQCYVRLDPL